MTRDDQCVLHVSPRASNRLTHTLRGAACLALAISAIVERTPEMAKELLEVGQEICSRLASRWSIWGGDKGEDGGLEEMVEETEDRNGP
jgi:hypothetical protein